MSCGVDYEFRTTAVKGLHVPEDFEAIGRWIAGAKEYYIQCFKDSGDLIAAQGLSAFSEDEDCTPLPDIRQAVCAGGAAPGHLTGLQFF